MVSAAAIRQKKKRRKRKIFFLLSLLPNSSSLWFLKENKEMGELERRRGELVQTFNESPPARGLHREREEEEEEKLFSWRGTSFH